ncbi:hypothetical protein B296_00008494 [Ensete ventricosum]|uniref:Histidine-containing phosphotransfer protein n=1 Tax=Ensete ventricosum TaxID=4639 RepID=A0A426ZXU2_ENSVE|nr:hypothetical protein B296_00008494 [Ensete ventricosum]
MRDRSNLVNPCGLQGLLDAQFRQLQMLQDASNPGFVAEVITLFCEDSERMLTELTKLLDQTVVDYQKVDAYVHQLKGSSSRCLLFFFFCAPFSIFSYMGLLLCSVGAQNVKLSCIQFKQFCEENNKEGLVLLLNICNHINI